jgi:hypothetical protein
VISFSFKLSHISSALEAERVQKLSRDLVSEAFRAQTEEWRSQCEVLRRIYESFWEGYAIVSFFSTKNRTQNNSDTKVLIPTRLTCFFYPHPKKVDKDFIL